MYRTDRNAYRYCQRYTDRETLPCGHTGVTNLVDGEYSCGEPTCDAEHDRATVKVHLTGSGGHDFTTSGEKHAMSQAVGPPSTQDTEESLTGP